MTQRSRGAPAGPYAGPRQRVVQSLKITIRATQCIANVHRGGDYNYSSDWHHHYSRQYHQVHLTVSIFVCNASVFH
jgi:hypothetical protein